MYSTPAQAKRAFDQRPFLPKLSGADGVRAAREKPARMVLPSANICGNLSRVVSKGRHQANDVNAAIKELPATVTVQQRKNGHTWGHLVCSVCGDRIRINSTPQSPSSHAAKLISWAAGHTHKTSKEG